MEPAFRQWGTYLLLLFVSEDPRHAKKQQGNDAVHHEVGQAAIWIPNGKKQYARAHRCDHPEHKHEALGLVHAPERVARTS
jgi:hypothetical protein